jgi:putative transposase
MTRLPYDSDLSDDEWSLIEPFVSQPHGPGRKRTVDTREVVNALCYMTRTGCQWRYLPHDFPYWEQVSYYYYEWLKDGTLDQLNDALREDLRIALGKEAEPSVGIMDSQSVKTAGPGHGRGFDGAKLVKGRKRHCIVDTLGLLLVVMVTAASVQESEGGVGVLLALQDKTDRLKKVYADQGYKDWLVEWCQRWKEWVLEIVKKPAEQVGFVVHPKRWLVERFFGWLNLYRRLSKDYERTVESSEGMIYLVSIQRMVRNLARRRKEMYS